MALKLTRWCIVRHTVAMNDVRRVQVELQIFFQELEFQLGLVAALS